MSSSIRNSRRKNRSPKNHLASSNGVPGGGKDIGYHSRSFPVPSKKRSPRKKETEFKQRSRRKRSRRVSPRVSDYKRSRKIQSRKKVVAIYTGNGGNDKHKASISYVRSRAMVNKL